MNPKLAAAIAAGTAKNQERLAAIRERNVAYWTREFTNDDWIYQEIASAIGEGRADIEIYSHGFKYERDRAEDAAEAVNRIDGLKAVVDTRDPNVFTPETTYFLRVTWQQSTPSQFGTAVNQLA